MFSLFELFVTGLFISLVTILFMQFINPIYIKSMSKNIETKILRSLWVIGIIFLLYVFLLMFDFIPEYMKIKESQTLLGSMGMLISAFIASASVMKNIANTNNLEDNKRKKIKIKVEIIFNTLFYITKNSINRSDFFKNIDELSMFYERTYKKIEEDNEVLSFCEHHETLKILTHIDKIEYELSKCRKLNLENIEEINSIRNNIYSGYIIYIALVHKDIEKIMEKYNMIIIQHID